MKIIFAKCDFHNPQIRSLFFHSFFKYVEIIAASFISRRIEMSGKYSQFAGQRRTLV